GGAVAAAPPSPAPPAPDPTTPHRFAAAPGGQPTPPPVTAAPVAPAALPSAVAGFARARAIAAEPQLPLPAPLPALSQPRSNSGLARFLGAWGGRTLWNQRGREVMLIVLSVDERAGTAEVLLAGNLGNPRTFSDGLSAGFERARARYEFGKL